MANSTLTNLFVDIADAIRETSDTSESIPALEFPDRIREISGGGAGGENLDTELEEQDDLISQMFEAVAKKTASGGGGGSGGIEGGYSVTFVDDDGTTAAIFSVLAGRAINAPVSGAPYWTDETGVRVSFPYTPVTDVVLDADTQTYADRLYKRFSISPSEHPYVLGKVYGSGATYALVVFAKTINGTNLYDGFATSGRVMDTIDRNNPEDFVSYFENNEFTLDSGSGYLDNMADNGYPNAFVNFDLTEYAPSYTGTVIDLNQ